MKKLYTRQSKKQKKGQGLVEFALALPILLAIIFGVIEFARVFQAWLVITNASRFGVRYAVTGEFDPENCPDYDGDDSFCAGDSKQAEEDTARLLTIYDVVDNAATMISKSDTNDKGAPSYFHITVCSSSPGFLYHPPPADYCDPTDDAGDPSEGPVRVQVAVSFEHPLILPFLTSLLPSVPLHAERTGIVEQFRVARVLGLPPVIDVPTLTPSLTPSPTMTATPTPTATPDCSNYSLSGFQISSDDLRINVNNAGTDNSRVVFVGVDWDNAWSWAKALGYDSLRVDWFKWSSSTFYSGDSYDSPTNVSADLALDAGDSKLLSADWDGGQAFNLWGLDASHFGVTVQLDNGCVLYEFADPLPTPTPNCDLYSMGDFELGSYAHLYLNVTNGDAIASQVNSIDLNWSYAESMDLLKDPNDELNVDYFQWGGHTTWGGGGVRDYDSSTNTSSDSPASFPDYWTTHGGLPEFDPGDSYSLNVDFDNEWSDWSTDLIPADFGITINFINGCTLHRAAVPRPLPTPDCGLYTVGDFSYYEWNRIAADIQNGDQFPANVTSLVLDWDYAESVSDIIVGVGPDNLNVDYFQWNWSTKWGSDVRDYSSTTNTSVDSPETWYGPLEFDDGNSYTFRADFDWSGETVWAMRDAWGLISDDFGLTVNFDNDCILQKTAIPRPIATPPPTCGMIYARNSRFSGDDFEIEVQNDNVAPANLIRSDLSWPAGVNPNSYFNYFRFDGNYYYDPPEHIDTSPVMKDGVSLPIAGSGDRAWWESDFNYGLPFGAYQGHLWFDFPDWGTCEILVDLIHSPTPTSTITPTPDPNATPTSPATMTPTQTPQTPTLTPSLTPTPTGTNTSTLIPTNTVQPGTATQSLTPSAIPYYTATPTSPALNSPTPTFTSVGGSSPTPTSTPCPGGGFDC